MSVSTSLRHGCAHRAKIKAIAAERQTVVIATRYASLLDDARNSIQELKAWAASGGRDVQMIYLEARHGNIDDRLSVVTVFTIKGPVTLPATVGRWEISKATPEQEALARKRASK